MTAATTDDLFEAGRLRGMIAAIAAISISAFGLSLSFPLFSIVLERMGISATMIGVTNAASAAAILASGPILPLILKRVSLPAMLIASLALMSALLLTFPLFPNVWVWLVLRFAFGFAAATLFFCSEIWIVSAAPPAKRGLMIGIYGLFLAIGFLMGPLLLKTIGTEGIAPFLAGAALVACGAPPILLAWRDSPPMDDHGGAGFLDVFRFFRTDPTVMFAILLFGAIEFGAMGLIPVWSLKIGMDESAALTLVALLAAGNVVMQVPMGWIGDKVNRMPLLGLCGAISIAAAIAAPLLAHTTWPLWIMTAAWGGFVVGLYTFSLNELGARYSGAAFARATGAVMIGYGFGALFAPPALGFALDAFPPHGMFHVVAAMSALYLALVIARRRYRRPGGA